MALLADQGARGWSINVGYKPLLIRADEVTGRWRLVQRGIEQHLEVCAPGTTGNRR